ncbi:MAG: M14 metallopeptidase family protein [Bacteroidota bacterium]
MKTSLLLLLLISTQAWAQEAYIPDASYNPAIPKPVDVLGYKIGDRFTDYRGLERVIDALVGSSDRIKRVVYGETYEHRALQLLIISSPGNLAKIESIRADNLRLTDPRRSGSTDRQKTSAESPGIVWFSYGVHGNESSSPEAALMTAYQLCAGTDPQTTALLDSLIILIDPNVNPDGRERYVRWINGAVGVEPNPNPDAAEHHEPWPGGRTNHYYFDLNRDWSWMTQGETRARIALYRRWMPHVHVDFHEMGYRSSYFFFPAAVPLHEAFPEEVRTWGAIYGKGNAEALDRFGIPYYTGEYFDLFYPGYGDSWPTFNGAIGMTYEQAGHSMGGVAIRKPTGALLTLEERARNHFLTGMATLTTTLRHRRERLNDFSRYWESALRMPSRIKAFVIPEGSDPGRAARMVTLLHHQGIEVHRLSDPLRSDAQKFFSGKTTREEFPAGTYFVSLAQPQSRLAKALLEPEATAKDTFFYDVSAWSLPVAYGLTAYTTDAPLPSSASKLSEPPVVTGRVVGGTARVAYLIPWERDASINVAGFLMRHGVNLSFASKSFGMSGRLFRPGTLIAFVTGNRDSLHALVNNAAGRYAVDIIAVHTGLTDQGIDLGSNSVRPMKNPRIAMLTDTPVSPNDFGELWFMFDREYELPFTAIRVSNLGSVDLSDYDVLLMPDGRYRGVIDSGLVAEMKHWVSRGGILIGIENGARFLTKNQSGLTSILLETDRKEGDKSKEETEEEKKKQEIVKRQTVYEKEESDRLARIPGTVFKAVVDTTHVIGFGYDRDVFVFKGDGPSLLLSEKAHSVVRFAPGTGSVSGYAPKERTQKVADSGYLMDFPLGRGHIVLAAENMTFRMFWTGHQKMLLNAIFFLPERN